MINRYLEKVGDERYFLVSGEDITVREYLGSQSISKLKDFVGKNNLLVIDEAQKVKEIGLNLKLIIDHIKDIKIKEVKDKTKDIKVSLNLDKSETAPFAPVGSTNEMVFSEIGPQSSLPVEFELLVDSDAASKAYKVPLSLAYSDTLNRNYSKTNVVAIIVGDKPDLGVTLERTEIYTSKSSGSVVLRLVNKGNPDIKFLNVKVLQNENIKVIGADEVYVGKLDSDDFSTAEFKLFFNGKESAKIPVEIAYKDANNNDYKELREVELKLYSISEARDFGVKKGNSFGWIVVAVAAVAGLYYYFRKRKKV